MPTPPLAETLPLAQDFVLAVLRASSAQALSWTEINRLAARWLRPATGDTSRLGHEVVLEMSRHGLLDIEMTSSACGDVMVSRATGVRPACASPTYRLAA